MELEDQLNHVEPLKERLILIFILLIQKDWKSTGKIEIEKILMNL